MAVRMEGGRDRSDCKDGGREGGRDRRGSKEGGRDRGREGMREGGREA